MFFGSLAAKKEGRKAGVLCETHSADKELETNWFDCFSSSFDCLEIWSLKCGRPEICGASMIVVTSCPHFLDAMPHYHYLSDHWQQQWLLGTWLHVQLVSAVWLKSKLVGQSTFWAACFSLRVIAGGCCSMLWCWWVCGWVFATGWPNHSLTCRLPHVMASGGSADCLCI